MELIESYKLYKKKLEETSNKYNKITNDDDSLLLSALHLLSSYRNYILLLVNNNKSPRIDKIKNFNTIERKGLEQLLEACIIYIESMQLNPSNILIEELNENSFKDPYTLLDIITADYMSNTLSYDVVYEEILKSLFNVVVKENFNKTLKELFLQFIHTKKI